jgi:hypothetical protein
VVEEEDMCSAVKRKTLERAETRENFQSRFYAAAGCTPELQMRTKPNGILGEWELPDSGSKGPPKKVEAVQPSGNVKLAPPVV